MVLGCAVAVGVPLTVAATRHGNASHVATIGAGAPSRLAAQSPAPAGATTAAEPSAGPTTAASVAGPPTTTSPPTRMSPPVRLAVSAVGISAPVVPVGVTATGEAQIPDRIDTVGWYRYGPAPGTAAGSIVLMGHVDDAVQGEGAFFRLHEIGAGAIVTVTTRDGVEHRFRVVGRQQYPKTAVPLQALFSRTGAPRLTLITCGGSFNRSARSYLDNIVVTAVPVG